MHYNQMLNLDTCSEAFAGALRSVGARVNTVLYPDKTHTDLFLQVCVFLFPFECIFEGTQRGYSFMSYNSVCRNQCLCLYLTP